MVRQHPYSEMAPWALIQYKGVTLPVWEIHCEDEIVIRSSYIHNGISYVGKLDGIFILNQSSEYGFMDSS